MVSDARMCRRIGVSPSTSLSDLPLSFVEWCRDFVRLETRLGWVE